MGITVDMIATTTLSTTSDEEDEDIDPFIDDFNQFQLEEKYDDNNINDEYNYNIHPIQIISSPIKAVDSDDFDEFKEDDGVSSLESDHDDGYNYNYNNQPFYNN